MFYSALKNHIISGNAYAENKAGFQVVTYCTRIFDINYENTCNHLNLFVDFNRFTNYSLALHQGNLYNQQFNMKTSYQLFGV